MKKSNTAARLRELMTERGLRQKDILDRCVPIARKYNIVFTKANLSMYVTGRVIPSQDKLLVMSEALGVSEVWLMGYDVSREKSANEYVARDVDRDLLIEVEQLDPAQKDLLRQYLELLKRSKQ